MPRRLPGETPERRTTSNATVSRYGVGAIPRTRIARHTSPRRATGNTASGVIVRSPPYLCCSAPPRAAQRHFARPDVESPGASGAASKGGRRPRAASYSEHMRRRTENSDSAESPEHRRSARHMSNDRGTRESQNPRGEGWNDRDGTNAQDHGRRRVASGPQGDITVTPLHWSLIAEMVVITMIHSDSREGNDGSHQSLDQICSHAVIVHIGDDSGAGTDIGEKGRTPIPRARNRPGVLETWSL